jgi:quercetin dioxygenase-like cupin family protein
MALPHAAPGQVVDILGSKVPSAQTLALFKSNELEVMRLVLPAGKAVPSHQVVGEITVQCLEGKFEFTAEGHTQVMHAGQLLHLSGGAEHSLVALEDASALVTIVLRE